MGTQPKARKKESHKTELARVAVAPFAVRRTVGIQAGCLTQRARARGGWCFSRAEVVFCSLCSLSRVSWILAAVMGRIGV